MKSFSEGKIAKNSKSFEQERFDKALKQVFEGENLNPDFSNFERSWFHGLQIIESIELPQIIKQENLRGVRPGLMENYIDPNAPDSPLRFVGSNGTLYRSFPGTHFFKNGVFNREDLVSLKNSPDKKILSVGSGMGFLEKLMRYVGISAHITLSDLDRQKTLDESFPFEQLDMYGDWLLDEKFDIIIFPESIIAPDSDSLEKAIRSSIEHLNGKDSQIRISSWLFSEWEVLLKSTIEKINEEGVVKLSYEEKGWRSRSGEWYKSGCEIRVV